MSFSILTSSTGSSSHLNVLIRTQMTKSIDLIAVLLEVGKDNGLCWHIDAHSECLCGKEELDESLTEENLYHFPQDGQKTAVMKGDALHQKRFQRVRLRHVLKLRVFMEVELPDVINRRSLG